MEPLPMRNLVLLPCGKQHVLMNEYQIPLDINNGLSYLHCCPTTSHDLETLPHNIMTADVDWNPNTFDNDIDDIETFYDSTEEFMHHGPFDRNGEHRYRIVAIDNTS
jgi:hypothetical protein